MKTVLKLGNNVEAHVETLYDSSHTRNPHHNVIYMDFSERGCVCALSDHKKEMVDKNNKPLAGLITNGTKIAFRCNFLLIVHVGFGLFETGFELILVYFDAFRSMSATIHVLLQVSKK